eukprot:2098561-Prymnesium_polylepis.2
MSGCALWPWCDHSVKQLSDGDLFHAARAWAPRQFVDGAARSTLVCCPRREFAEFFFEIWAHRGFEKNCRNVGASAAAARCNYLSKNFDFRFAPGDPRPVH